MLGHFMGTALRKVSLVIVKCVMYQLPVSSSWNYSVQEEKTCFLSHNITQRKYSHFTVGYVLHKSVMETWLLSGGH